MILSISIVPRSTIIWGGEARCRMRRRKTGRSAGCNQSRKVAATIGSARRLIARLARTTCAHDAGRLSRKQGMMGVAEHGRVYAPFAVNLGEYEDPVSGNVLRLPAKQKWKRGRRDKPGAILCRQN